jgi:hypothetical protein
LPLQLVEAGGDHLEIGEAELGGDGIQVVERIVRADPCDRALLKAPQHMSNRVDAADVLQELVSQPLASRGALDQPGDVDELDDGGRHLPGGADLGHPMQSLVRNLDDPDVGIDGAKRVVLRRHRDRGEGLEERRLPDVGKPDDAHGKVGHVRLCTRGRGNRARVPLPRRADAPREGSERYCRMATTIPVRLPRLHGSGFDAPRIRRQRLMDAALLIRVRPPDPPGMRPPDRPVDTAPQSA